MRAPLLLIAQDPATGNAVPGATARLRDDSVIPPADLDPSEIFTDRAGAGTEPANPVVTDANGMKMVFLERRQLRIEWSHGITTFVDVLPAGDGGIDAGAIDPAGLPPADALQEGVVGANDLTVTRNSSSQVTLAAGRIWIRTPAGVLVPVTLTGSTVLSGIPPATGSNKRLDQVTVDHTGTVRYRQGTTEATGVTIDNRTGAFVLPAGERVVEDLLITSAGVVAGATNMRDRRPWAHGVEIAVNTNVATLNTGGNTNPVGPSTRLEIQSTLVHVEFNAAYNQPANTGVNCGIKIDDTVFRLAGIYNPGGAMAGVLSGGLPVTVVPGSRLFTPTGWRDITNGSSLAAGACTIREIVTPNASNGTA